MPMRREVYRKIVRAAESPQFRETSYMRGAKSQFRHQKGCLKHVPLKFFAVEGRFISIVRRP